MGNGFKIITLLHDITQLDYQVQFCRDFTGMIRIEYKDEYNEEYYHHEHLSYPDGPIEQLEEKVLESLTRFYAEHKESK